MKIQISSSAPEMGLAAAVALVSRLEQALLKDEGFRSKIASFRDPYLQWVLTDEGWEACRPGHCLTVFLCSSVRVITQLTGGCFPHHSGENIAELPVKIATAQATLEIHDDHVVIASGFSLNGCDMPEKTEQALIASLLEYMASTEAYVDKDRSPYYGGTPTPQEER